MGILHNTSLDIMLKEESSKLNAQTPTPTTEIPKWETDHLGLCRYILQDLGISDLSLIPLKQFIQYGAAATAHTAATAPTACQATLLIVQS